MILKNVLLINLHDLSLNGHNASWFLDGRNSLNTLSDPSNTSEMNYSIRGYCVTKRISSFFKKSRINRKETMTGVMFSLHLF